MAGMTGKDQSKFLESEPKQYAVTMKGKGNIVNIQNSMEKVKV
tara:strand:- start:709 stop:837 length:129 start_codon:yes stop_codon:yes gene_type:complete